MTLPSITWLSDEFLYTTIGGINDRIRFLCTMDDGVVTRVTAHADFVGFRSAEVKWK